MARRSTHRLLTADKRKQALEKVIEDRNRDQSAQLTLEQRNQAADKETTAQRQKISRLRDEREQQTGADEGSRRIGPVKTKPANAGVNQQKGNPRFGQKYTEKQVAGGEKHTYSDGTSVFVRKTQGPQNALNKGRGVNLAQTRTQGVNRADLTQQIADQRKKRKTRRVPMVGTGRG